MDDDNDCFYWFYFGSNGKKNRSARKSLDGKQYTFDTEDDHMLTGWAAATRSNATPAIIPDSSVKYLRNDGSAQKNSWVWAVPDEDYIKEDYDDEYSWWYTNNSGKVYTNEVKKINNKRYALDGYGRMLTGFVTAGPTRKDVKSVGSADEVSETDLYANCFPILYFCSDDEADGAVRTGYQTITIEDGDRQFWFNSSGVGTTGYVSSISKFTVSGMVLCADKDEANYAAVPVKAGTADYEMNDKINGLLYGNAIRADGNYVLVNKSGSVQKNKKNLKCDDLYFCTDKDGRVTYTGYEKDN